MRTLGVARRGVAALGATVGAFGLFDLPYARGTHLWLGLAVLGSAVLPFSRRFEAQLLARALWLQVLLVSALRVLWGSGRELGPALATAVVLSASLAVLGLDRLTTDELVMMVEAVIVGGTDTTRNQLGLCLAVFLDHPDQWQMLAEDPGLAPRAVEETMRYFGAVNGTIRYASEDIEMDGVLYPKGTFMSTSLGTANFDESVFPGAGTFDITREPVGSPHMSFGSGIHYCLGAPLARAELQEALALLPRRMPGITRAGATVMKPATTAIFGPAEMPIAFDAGH